MVEEISEQSKWIIRRLCVGWSFIVPGDRVTLGCFVTVVSIVRKRVLAHRLVLVKDCIGLILDVPDIIDGHVVRWLVQLNAGEDSRGLERPTLSYFSNLAIVGSSQFEERIASGQCLIQLGESIRGELLNDGLLGHALGNAITDHVSIAIQDRITEQICLISLIVCVEPTNPAELSRKHTIGTTDKKRRVVIELETHTAGDVSRPRSVVW